VTAITILFEYVCYFTVTNFLIYSISEICDNNVRLDYLQSGSFFAHNKDKDGKMLLIFKSKKHVKGQRDMEELKRCVVYWFERLER
jgi:hypothetical protein